MSDKPLFRSVIRFEAPQEGDQFQGERVRHAVKANGEIQLEFFNAKQERCTLTFAARDLRAVLDFKLLWSLFRR